MDANSFRFVLIALAGVVVISLNVPWRHLARTISRCIAILAAPRLPADDPGANYRRSPAGSPWLDLSHRFAVAPLVDTRRYRPPRSAHPR